MARRVGLFLGSVGSNSGGPERYERELVRNIAALERDTEFEIVCLNRAGPEKIGLTQDNFNFRTLWPANRAVSMMTSLPITLARQRLDVLHATFVPPPLTNHPYVFTLVCSSMFEHPEFYPPAIRLRLVALMRRAVKQSQLILCVSKHVRDVVVERFAIPEERATVVYLGASEDFVPMPPDESRAVVRERHGIDGPYLLFSGRWERRKNVAGILEAFHRFRSETGAPHKLVFTGEQTWGRREAEEVIRRHGMADAIVNLGKSPVEHLPHLYSAADALVYTSLWEGFGMPIVEAMRANTPVLTSNNSSMAEIGGDAAVQVDPFSADAIAEGMHRITTDAALRVRLREKGRARAAGFTWRNTAERTLAAYRQAEQLGRR